MLYEQSRFFQRLMFLGDVVLVFISWLVAYYIRFEVLTPPEYVSLDRYLAFVPWVLIVSTFVFWSSGLYAPERAQRLTSLVLGVVKAVLIGLVVLLASLFLYRAFSFSRLMLILFGFFAPVLMVILRILIFAVITRARRAGRNAIRVIIYGAGTTGQKLREAFEQFPWMGVEVVGFIDDENESDNTILGTGGDLLRIVDENESAGTHIDYVYFALPLTALDRVAQLVDQLASRLVHVCLVPDLFQFDLLNSRVTHLGGLPVIHVIDEVPISFAVVMKRIFDILFSVVVILVTSPLLLLIALAVKISSRGTVLYRQERMGLNGARFSMLKFRTMPEDAERDSGPVWATHGESRATRVGHLLRRTSLDELPQFFNVLKGQMSVVGPRPERPVFIQDFRNRVPGYMLRHKTKAGITGWAQVNGWRGNTSLEKRIEYDLYYIQNWSLTLDLKIMWLTLWRGFVHENAH
ncbi:MAG: undecaprenyl-phosphate glucose phosphotransferase [Rhodothermales bacterium]|nr:undecaprenyl-phosphate glucose phosphotransferase [Rhodothermales bacterium]